MHSNPKIVLWKIVGFGLLFFGLLLGMIFKTGALAEKVSVITTQPITCERFSLLGRWSELKTENPRIFQEQGNWLRALRITSDRAGGGQLIIQNTTYAFRYAAGVTVITPSVVQRRLFMNTRSPFMVAVFWYPLQQLLKIPLLFILSFVGWGLAILGFGYGTRRVLNLAASNVVDDVFIIPGLGMLGLTVLAMLANFFIPVNAVSGIGMLLGLLVLWLHRQEFQLSYLRDWSFVVLAGVFMLLAATPSDANFDTGLYHIQATRWHMEQTLPVGGANLHIRHAYNSFWFVFSSVVCPRIAGNLFLSSNALLMLFFCFWVFSGLKQKQPRSVFYFLVLIVLFGHGYNVSNNSPDFPLTLFIVSVTSMLLSRKDYKKFQVLAFALLLSIFAVTIKMSALFPIIVLGSVMVWQSHDSLLAQWRVFSLGVVLLLLWILKSVLVSGYLVYPVLATAIPVAWRVPEVLVREDVAGIQFMLHGGVTWQRWLEIFMQYDAVFAVVIVGLLGLTLFAKRQSRIPVLATSYVFSGFIFWLVMAPELRYGEPYLFSLLLLWWVLYVPQTPALKSFFEKLLGLGLLVYFVFGLVAFTPCPIRAVPFERTIINAQPVYFPTLSDRAWDAPLPVATHQPDPRKLTVAYNHHRYWFYTKQEK